MAFVFRPLAAAFAAFVLLACESKEAPAPKPAPVIYRYREKNGTLHFTDDLTSIPPGAKVEETTGADIKVVKEERIDAGPQLVGGEAEWRARFREANTRIAQLEQSIAADANIAGAAETNPMIEEAMGNDENYISALRRLRAAREALKRQKAALVELHRTADSVNVPKEWRGD